MSSRRTAIEPRYQASLDFYETPAWAVDVLVPHLPNLWRGPVLDPCAGRGAILDALEAHGVAGRGIELDPSRAREADLSRPVACDDALALPVRSWCAEPCVVMNPPFARAEEFVRRALVEVGSSGTVAALLRLAFLEGKARAALHRAFPADVLVLSERPSFVVSLSCARGKVTRESGDSCGWAVQLPPAAARPVRCPECNGPIRTTTADSSAYAWCVWGPGRGGRWGILVRPPCAE